jgi:hypothetical protein
MRFVGRLLKAFILIMPVFLLVFYLTLGRDLSDVWPILVPGIVVMIIIGNYIVFKK